MSSGTLLPFSSLFDSVDLLQIQFVEQVCDLRKVRYLSTPFQHHYQISMLIFGVFMKETKYKISMYLGKMPSPSLTCKGRIAH